MKQIRCPGCGVTMHYLPQHEGQNFQCPKCTSSIAIPRPASPRPSPPPPLRSTPPAPPAPVNPFAASASNGAASDLFGRRDAGAPASVAASAPSEPTAADADEPPYDVVESREELPEERRHPWTPPRPRTPARDQHEAGHGAFFDFSFEKFVTPWLIRVVWAIAVVLTALFGAILLCIAMVKPHSGSLYEPTIFTYLGLIVSLFISLVGYRILCEAAIVFFDIRDTLRRMERHLADSPTRATHDR